MHLVPIGSFPASLVRRLAHRLDCSVAGEPLDPAFAFNSARGQYDSTALLDHLPTGAVGLIGADLFIPILEFVFGEAYLGGHRAIVSACRLQQEFYGLPPDPDLLLDRLVKEVLHEWGHARGLRHCLDYQCAMSAAHSVELIDLKDPTYCLHCQRL